jgi:hypothetical protein
MADPTTRLKVGGEEGVYITNTRRMLCETASDPRDGGCVAGEIAGGCQSRAATGIRPQRLATLQGGHPCKILKG